MHFTYKNPEGCLQQGDILHISDEIKSILEAYHPHYSNHTDYKFLMVLTQSCDLAVRPNGKCKSRYITLAAVRSVNTLLTRELNKFQRSTIEKKGNICSLDNLNRMEDYLYKLYNNNLPGYFYLAEEAEFGLEEPVVAFLSLSIALKSNEHYEKCKIARIAQLDDIFQAKLGWLLGNEFSRVGTPDWVPQQSSEEEFSSKINDDLGKLCLWINKKGMNYLKKELKKKRNEVDAEYFFSYDELIKNIKQFQKNEETKLEKIIEKFIEVLKEKFQDLENDELVQLSNRLKNNDELKRLL